jgi:hypothetical protein
MVSFHVRRRIMPAMASPCPARALTISAGCLDGRVSALRRPLASILSALLASAALLGGARSEEAPRLTVAGPEEIVVAAETMACRGKRRPGIDVTDIPPTAYRRDDGTVVMIAGNRNNFHFEGPDLDRVRRASCTSLLEPVNDPDPGRFRSHEWLAALHSRDGRRVLGFVHHEYHGHEHGHPGCVFTNRQDYPCWYGSVTLVTSEDGGRTFSRPPPAENVLLSLPRPFREGAKRSGVVLPKVVGNPKDGKVYVFGTFVDRNRRGRGGQCLLRGSGESVGDWERWDGERFQRFDSNPYGCSGACTGRLDPCVTVIPGNIFSVRYIPAHDRFVALGMSREGVVYRLSPDLVRWSEERSLWETTINANWRSGDPSPGWYFSLLDPTSSSRNFDTLEERPYLYFVRFRVANDRIVNARRDVVRVPLRID